MLHCFSLLSAEANSFPSDDDINAAPDSGRKMRFAPEGLLVARMGSESSGVGSESGTNLVIPGINSCIWNNICHSFKLQDHYLCLSLVLYKLLFNLTTCLCLEYN